MQPSQVWTSMYTPEAPPRFSPKPARQNLVSTAQSSTYTPLSLNSLVGSEARPFPPIPVCNSRPADPFSAYAWSPQKQKPLVPLDFNKPSNLDFANTTSLLDRFGMLGDSSWRDKPYYSQTIQPSHGQPSQPGQPGQPSNQTNKNTQTKPTQINKNIQQSHQNTTNTTKPTTPALPAQPAQTTQLDGNAFIDPGNHKTGNKPTKSKSGAKAKGSPEPALATPAPSPVRTPPTRSVSPGLEADVMSAKHTLRAFTANLANVESPILLPEPELNSVCSPEFAEMALFFNLAPGPIETVSAQVLDVCTDQYGARSVQERLAVCEPRLRSEFVACIARNAHSLAADAFGNYVVQVCLELGTPSSRSEVHSALRGSFVSLSMQPFGCRVVQTALRVLDTAQKAAIVDELDGKALQLATDLSGNHVMQRVFELAPPSASSSAYCELQPHLAELARHMYGCRVVQRVLEFGQPAVRSAVLKAIQSSLEVMVLDQYGNYVVQHVLDHGSRREREGVIAGLAPRVVALSTHKYASNVMEKCLARCSPKQRSAMIDAVLTAGSDPDATVLMMMKDQYANYVVQRLLTNASAQDYARLSAIVRRNLPHISRKRGVRHLQAIERCLT